MISDSNIRVSGDIALGHTIACSQMAPKVDGHMDTRSWSMLILLALVWGAAFVMVGHALDSLPVLTVTALRVGIAAIALVSLVVILGLRPKLTRPKLTRVELRDLAVMGVLNNVFPFTLIVFGQQFVTSGLASVLNAMTPIWAFLVGWAFLRVEGFTLRRFFGLVAALAGVAVLAGPAAFQGTEGGIIGQVAVLLAGLSYAFASYWGRRLTHLPSLVAATGQLVSSSTVMTILAFMIDSPLSLDWAAALDSGAVWSMVGCALFGTACAYLLYFEILKRAGPVNTMFVTYLVPPAAILMAWPTLGEAPSIELAAAAVLIFIGIYLASKKSDTSQKSAKP